MRIQSFVARIRYGPEKHRPNHGVVAIDSIMALACAIDMTSKATVDTILLLHKRAMAAEARV